MGDQVERVARAMWEQRRRWSAEKYGVYLEPWDDRNLPQENGIMEEARVAIQAAMLPARDEPLDNISSADQVSGRYW